MSQEILREFEQKKFVIITPVWGKTHIELFLNICIPSMLVPNNLPAFALNSQIDYLIYTDLGDLETLKKSPVILKLKQFLNVDFRVIPNLTDNKHHKMSQCHKYAIEYAAKNDAYLFFIPPDVIWANSSLLKLRQLVDSGFDVIHISGLRLSYETFVPQILKYVQKDETININPRALVSLALQNLHSITYNHFYEEHQDKGGLIPSNLLWSVGKQGILARCFHLLPIITKPKVEYTHFGDTIDGEMLLNLDKEKEYIVKDSDEFLLFEISSDTYKINGFGAKESIDVAAQWSTKAANIKHVSQIKHNIRIHTDVIDEKAWLQAEEHAECIVDAIIKRRHELLGQYMLVTPVWGASSLNLFLNYCLPSLLSQNNIKAFLAYNNPVYYIYTDSASEEVIQNDANFAKLKSMMQVEVIIDPLYIGNVYNCYTSHVNNPDFKMTYVIPIPPNSLWAAGTLKAIQEMNMHSLSDVQIEMKNLPIRKVSDELKNYIRKDKSLKIEVSQLQEIAKKNRYLYPKAYYIPISIFSRERCDVYKTSGMVLSTFVQDTSMFVDAVSRNVQVCLLTDNNFSFVKKVYLRSRTILSKSINRSLNLINRIINRIERIFAFN